MRKIVAGKLHGIYVTEANLDYHGSITLDPDHCEEAGILPMEFVEIWNKNSGARISTYVILGERGSRCCVLNGAAARTCQAGDQVITLTQAGHTLIPARRPSRDYVRTGSIGTITAGISSAMRPMGRRPRSSRRARSACSVSGQAAGSNVRREGSNRERPGMPASSRSTRSPQQRQCERRYRGRRRSRTARGAQ